jgi:hypothetical protein
LEFDLCGAAAHRTHDDLDVVTDAGHQFQQLGFADAAELAAGDAGDLGLVDTQQLGGVLLGQPDRTASPGSRLSGVQPLRVRNL